MPHYGIPNDPGISIHLFDSYIELVPTRGSIIGILVVMVLTSIFIYAMAFQASVTEFIIFACFAALFVVPLTFRLLRPLVRYDKNSNTYYVYGVGIFGKVSGKGPIVLEVTHTTHQGQEAYLLCCRAADGQVYQLAIAANETILRNLAEQFNRNVMSK
jgi:hypothetical protein